MSLEATVSSAAPQSNSKRRGLRRVEVAQSQFDRPQSDLDKSPFLPLETYRVKQAELLIFAGLRLRRTSAGRAAWKCKAAGSLARTMDLQSAWDRCLSVRHAHIWHTNRHP